MLRISKFYEERENKFIFFMFFFLKDIGQLTVDGLGERYRESVRKKNQQDITP